MNKKTKRYVVYQLVQVKNQVKEKIVFNCDTYAEADIWQWNQQEPHKFYIEDTLHPAKYDFVEDSSDVEYDYAD